MNLTPETVVSHPGARIVFSATQEGSLVPLSNGQWEAIVYFPGEEPENGVIHESNNTFFWVVPPQSGKFEVGVLLKRGDEEWWTRFEITINPAQAATLRATMSMGGLASPVHMDVYDPMGEMMYSEEVTGKAPNYWIEFRPGLDWIDGEYQIYLRDANGIQDIDSQWVQRPKLASMGTFYGLPIWHRQLLSYLKFELMGDTEPMHPGALFTLEEYAKHWFYTIEEINNIPPYTTFHPNGIPMFWGNVTLKGTLCRVYHALANRSVTIPRWTGVPVAIQDESHYQQSWEARYNLLREEYKEERAYMKAAHLPGPSVTVDPWLGWGGGNLAGTAGLALIGRPTWFTRNFGGRG